MATINDNFQISFSKMLNIEHNYVYTGCPLLNNLILKLSTDIVQNVEELCRGHNKGLKASLSK